MRIAFVHALISEITKQIPADVSKLYAQGSFKRFSYF